MALILFESIVFWAASFPFTPKFLFQNLVVFLCMFISSSLFLSGGEKSFVTKDEYLKEFNCFFFRRMFYTASNFL